MSSAVEEVATGLMGHGMPAGTAKAMADVFDERFAQIGRGFDAAHDDAHGKGQLLSAALHYAASAKLAGLGVRYWKSEALRIDVLSIGIRWPFEAEWWKPGLPRRMLVKACALLIAEIERLDRQPPQPDA